MCSTVRVSHTIKQGVFTNRAEQVFFHCFNNNRLGTPINIVFACNSLAIQSDSKVLPIPHVNTRSPLRLFAK